MLVLSSPLCSPPEVCILGMCSLWKGKLRQTAPQNNSTPPRATLGDRPLHRATTAMSLPCSTAPTEAVPSLKGDAPSPTSLCPSPPTPNASHGRARAGTLVPPQLAQSCCLWGFHGAEHPSRAGGRSLARLSPRVCTPVQKWHQRPTPKGLPKDAGRAQPPWPACSGPRWGHQGWWTSRPPLLLGPTMLTEHHGNPCVSQTLEETS